MGEPVFVTAQHGFPDFTEIRRDFSLSGAKSKASIRYFVIDSVACRAWLGPRRSRTGKIREEGSMRRCLVPETA
jgi:hypothetical protein